MSIHPDHIGCDVSKAHLDFFDGTCGVHTRIANTHEALSAWLKALKDRKPFVVFEATGRHDRLLSRALCAHGLEHRRVNPERARAYAKAIGQLAKTDRIDARLLAHMGRTLNPKAPLPDNRERVRLASLHRRRTQLVDMRKVDKQRLSEAEPHERPSLMRHITWLDREIAKVEETAQKLLQETAALRDQVRLLRSIAGIGPVTAMALTALLPELGTGSAKSLSALVGLAPFNADSGRFSGKRSIRGGRKQVRDALYMAAVTAARSNSRFKTFANTLNDKGKPFKVRTIAVARKILTIANAVIRDQKPFKP